MVKCDADRRTYDSHLWASSEGRHSILPPLSVVCFFSPFLKKGPPTSSVTILLNQIFPCLYLLNYLVHFIYTPFLASQMESILSHLLHVPKASRKAPWVDKWIRSSSDIYVPISLARRKSSSGSLCRTRLESQPIQGMRNRTFAPGPPPCAWMQSHCPSARSNTPPLVLRLPRCSKCVKRPDRDPDPRGYLCADMPLQFTVLHRGPLLSQLGIFDK